MGDPTMDTSDSLDHLRIRRVMLDRRALHRAAQWNFALILASGVASAACLKGAYDVAQQSRYPAAIGLFIAGLLSIVAMVHLKLRRKSILNRLTRTSLPEPDSPPDFTTLNDGSQFARALNEMIAPSHADTTVPTPTSAEVRPADMNETEPRRDGMSDR